MSLSELAGRARDLAVSHRAILGIAGPPGAGKSTLVARLLQELADTPPAGAPPGSWIAHVPMDGFHLAYVELDRLGLRDRKGTPETFDAVGYLALLRRIRAEQTTTIYAPGFERILEQPIAASIAVLPEVRLVITEGNYLLLPDGAWPLVRAELDEVWYVDLDDEVRRRRLIARHVEFGKSPEGAAEWVRRSDEPNARRVIDNRRAADVTVASDA